MGPYKEAKDLNRKGDVMGIPWWSSGWFFVLLLPRAQVQFLVGELRSSCTVWPTPSPPKSDVVMERGRERGRDTGGCYVAGFEDEGRGYKLKNAGSLQRLKKVRNWIVL